MPRCHGVSQVTSIQQISISLPYVGIHVLVRSGTMVPLEFFVDLRCVPFYRFVGGSWEEFTTALRREEQSCAVIGLAHINMESKMLVDERHLVGRKRQRRSSSTTSDDHKSNTSTSLFSNRHNETMSSSTTSDHKSKASILFSNSDRHRRSSMGRNPTSILVLALTLFLVTISGCHAKEDDKNDGCDKCLVDPLKAHWNTAAAKAQYVVHVVADGLRPDLMLDYPNFAYLKSHGVGTGNARNQLLSSQTLPNHISMFTGLSVAEHGHVEDGDSKEKLTSFANIFDLVKAVGGTTAFYGAKEKFETFEKQWQIDNYVFTKWAHRVMNNWQDDMTNTPYTYSFVHFRETDRAGHLSTGANSTEYAAAVQQMDEYIGQMLDFIEKTPALNGKTAIVLTSDHGFEQYGNHNDLDDPLNFKIPFYVYDGGSHVLENKDIYELNSLADPGDERITPSCITNAYAGVLSASLLGISYDEGPFSNQYLSVTGATDSSSAAALTNEAAIDQAPTELLPPSGVGIAPTADPDDCVYCPNEPNEQMKLKGRACESWRLVPEKCLSPSNQWVEEQTCKRSCYFHGNPYDSTICCRNAEPPTLPIPLASEPEPPVPEDLVSAAPISTPEKAADAEPEISDPDENIGTT